MDNHLLTEIEIKDFKCFKDFKADGFKRVNLIGGKNNVGKTAFMEACYINLHAKNINSFSKALSNIKLMRETLNILGDLVNNKKSFDAIDIIKKSIEVSNNIYTKSNISTAGYKIIEDKGIKEYSFNINNEIVKVNIKEFSFGTEKIKNIFFIDNFGLTNNEIINYYSAIQKRDEEPFLNSILNQFDERVESFKIIDEKPQCKIDDEYLEITEFGDGVRHLVSIVTSLYECENGYLFIDEIDNGIHYTQLDEIWKIILEVSKTLNVQVFATTHSKECIESYARVAKKLEDKEICYIKMSRLKDGSIKAGVRDFDMLQDSIDDAHEVRGW